MKTYTVKGNESIKQIASRSKISAAAIFNVNRDLLGSTPANVAAGMTLNIPADDAEGGIGESKESDDDGDS